MTTLPPVLDLRPAAAFLAGHAPGAANVPLEELTRRSHELPPKGAALRPYDDDPARLRKAAEALRLRGYAVDDAALSATDLVETGPSRTRLWQPSPLLIEALELIGVTEGESETERGGSPHPPRNDMPYGAVGTGPHRAKPVHTEVPLAACPPVPSEQHTGGQAARGTRGTNSPKTIPLGHALDVACGSGREAVWLARAGFEVEGIDILPDALERAADLARRSGVTLNLRPMDLRRETLPEWQYDLVTVFRFLLRPALATIRESLAPDGVIVYEAFNERDTGGGEKPLKDSRTLRDGELSLVFAGFEVLLARDGVEREGRVFSQFVGRRI
jgi:tellurite methyltransferase